MASASESVREMAALSEQGRTPPLLQAFLRETFPRGLLRRLLLGPCGYEVTRVEPFSDAGFFRSAAVFWVTACDRVLERAVLPSGGSIGLFALASGGLRYLNHRRHALERLLREENRPLDECDPSVLAALVAEALLRQRTSAHDVLRSADLGEYARDLPWARGYEVDAREWERVRASVVSPVIAGEAGSGWRLAFCSLFGWMHQKEVLVRHLVKFSPDFRIAAEQRVLSRRIFARTPSIRY